MTASAHFTKGSSSELQRSLGSGEIMSSPVSGRCHRCVSAIVLTVNDSKYSKQGKPDKKEGLVRNWESSPRHHDCSTEEGQKTDYRSNVRTNMQGSLWINGLA